MNFYKLLQVSPDADIEVIKAAFRAIMVRLNAHPDRGGDAQLAQDLVEAYHALSDPEKRKEYDRDLANFSSAQKAKPEQKSLPQQSAVVVVKPDKSSVAVKFEQRVLSRIPIDKKIYLKSKNIKTPLEVQLKDLSGGGAQMECEQDLILDQLVELCLAKEDLPFVIAQVVRKEKVKGVYGIKWMQLDERQLKGFLTKKRL